ncbi:-S-isoprenylcysteine O-methyltransferase [Lecanosticta acicola]|uniref:Protein-S-isoprenylcysteine O-methyltransferase n=1 Tax=Lecanosticta acicola TaxID=111012 RepID=A0AAI8Z0Q9_9PEZI|nr:-S-isoprenylcysteine O-methyltransferase [Lecanosticta acicola]
MAHPMATGEAATSSAAAASPFDDTNVNGHTNSRPRHTHPAFPTENGNTTNTNNNNCNRLEDSLCSSASYSLYSDDNEMDDPTTDTFPVPHDPTLLPGGSRDLSFISLQAFLCGSVFATGLLCSLFLIHHNVPWWRLPAFLTCLSLFHYLEFWTTAAYNVPAVRASSFLLYNNGRAYTLAHTMASIEIVLSQFLPSYQKFLVSPWTISLGMLLVLIGQSARSIAMAQAGTNFNHILVTERKRDHELVIDGLYAYFRHPSYFGFFWWAIGTQLLVGNKICLVGYAVVLWKFFSNRIRKEERHLVDFFGDKYVEYRKRTGTRIPFVP